MTVWSVDVGYQRIPLRQPDKLLVICHLVLVRHGVKIYGLSLDEKMRFGLPLNLPLNVNMTPHSRLSVNRRIGIKKKAKEIFKTNILPNKIWQIKD